MVEKFAREVGIEPTTNRLTGDRSTAELLPNLLFHQEVVYYLNYSRMSYIFKNIDILAEFQ